MQRTLELARLWPYLPHFRVVAEFESLAKASKRIGISAAALSKAIRTLERTLGLELFDRGGGTFRLNGHGRSLLAALRGAMRDLDDAITATRQLGLLAHVRVAMDAVWTPLLLPPENDACVVDLVETSASVARGLLRGEVDVAVHVEPITHVDLDVAVIATLPRAVCVASRHSLGGKRLRGDDLARVGFASLRPLDGALDGWPRQVPRRVVVTASSLSQLLAAVASGAVAAVLPIAMARGFELRPVEVTGLKLAPLLLWASIRRPRHGSSDAARWRTAAQQHCAARIAAAL